MTANMISLYGAAVAAIAMLCWFARQNQKSGWKRNRAGSMAEALNDFYRDLGIANEEAATRQQPEPQPRQMTGEEELGFSAQMLRLRSALGASATVTQTSPLSQRELVHR